MDNELEDAGPLISLDSCSSHSWKSWLVVQWTTTLSATLPASPNYERLETKGKANLELASFINTLQVTRTWVSIFSFHTYGMTLLKLPSGTAKL